MNEPAWFDRSYRRVILVGLGVTWVLAGCASSPKVKLPPPTGDPVVDGRNAIEFGPTRDRVLWQYRTALADMRRLDYEEAKSFLDAAIARMEGSFAPDKLAKKSRGYFSAEAKKTFLGEPYERVMAYYYRGILYWMDGELDNARACFLSGQLHDSDATDKKYASDYRLLGYLEGLVTSKLGGDGSDAFRRSENLEQGPKPPPYSERSNVMVFVDYGTGPRKIATGQYGEQLRFRKLNSPVRSARLKVNGQTVPLPPYDDLFYQATTRGGRVMDHILANQAVFKSATGTAGDAALISGAILATDRDTSEIGLGLLAAGAISKIISAATTPEADTRTWDNLPLYLSFGALDLPSGDHALTVEFLGESNQVLSKLTKSINLHVPPGSGDLAIYVSDQSVPSQTL